MLELGAGQQRQEVVDGGVLRQQRDRRLDQQDVEAAPPHLRGRGSSFVRFINFYLYLRTCFSGRNVRFAL